MKPEQSLYQNPTTKRAKQPIINGSNIIDLAVIGASLLSLVYAIAGLVRG